MFMYVSFKSSYLCVKSSDATNGFVKFPEKIKRGHEDDNNPCAMPEQAAKLLKVAGKSIYLKFPVYDNVTDRKPYSMGLKPSLALVSRLTASPEGGTVAGGRARLL